MQTTLRGAARAVANAYPLSRMRSFEERLGIVAFAALLLFAASQTLMAHDYKAGGLEIGHPWSRATPPGARVAAGYATIRNTGAEVDRLVGAAGEIAGRAEIHEMAVDDKGVMTMRPVEGVEIPAGGAAELRPGGFHIMFLDVAAPAREGERFKGSLTFEKAGTVEVEFAVEAMGGGGDHGSHGEQGHGGHGG